MAKKITVYTHEPRKIKVEAADAVSALAESLGVTFSLEGSRVRAQGTHPSYARASDLSHTSNVLMALLRELGLTVAVDPSGAHCVQPVEKPKKRK